MSHRAPWVSSLAASIALLALAPSAADAQACPEVVIPSGLPGGEAMAPYRVRITASGGKAPYRFAVTGGALPTGLTLYPGGILQGIPRQPHYGSTFKVTVTDANGCRGSRGLYLYIDWRRDIWPAWLQDANVGQPYDQAVQATGHATSYVVAGGLPPGITLQSSSGTWRLAGTPTTPGGFAFEIRAYGDGSFRHAYVLNVAGSCPPVTVTTASLPDAVVGLHYTHKIQATGGCQPMGLTGAQLPLDLEILPDGTLVGLPWYTGTFTFTVTAHAGAEASRSYTLTVRPRFR